MYIAENINNVFEENSKIIRLSAGQQLTVIGGAPEPEYLQCFWSAVYPMGELKISAAHSSASDKKVYYSMHKLQFL